MKSPMAQRHTARIMPKENGLYPTFFGSGVPVVHKTLSDEKALPLYIVARVEGCSREEGHLLESIFIFLCVCE